MSRGAKAAAVATFLVQHTVTELPLGDLVESLFEEVKVAFQSRDLNYAQADAFRATLERSSSVLQQLEANQSHDECLHAPVGAVIPEYRRLLGEIGTRCQKWRTKPYWKQLRQAKQYRDEFDAFRTRLSDILAEANLAVSAQEVANAERRAQQAERHAKKGARQLKVLEARLTVPTSYVPHPQPLIGREEQLRGLAKLFQKPRTMVALVGRGGSGKSHCAKAFARQWADEDARRWVHWLNSETSAELRQAYMRLLTSLGSVTPTEDLSIEEIADHVWVQLKLNQFDHLLVFDNAPEVDESGNEGPDALESRFLPIEYDYWSRGRILFTSRSALFDGKTSIGNITKVDVGPLSPKAAVQMLLTDGQEASRATAEILVNDLECLPLAISCVSGLLHDKDLRLEDLQLKATDRVNEVMQKALEYARAQPELRNILDVAAFVNPDAITLDLLGGDMAAVSRLCNMSLLRWVHGNVYSIHRLYQDVLQRGHSPGAAVGALERVLKGFNRNNASTFALGKSMSVHVEAVLKHARLITKLSERNKLVNVLHVNAVVLLRVEFSYQAAEHTARKALEMIADEGSELRALTLDILGTVCAKRRNFEEAEATLKGALETKRRIYGADAKNKDLAKTLLQLGIVRAHRCNQEEALERSSILEETEALFKEALDMMIHEYGADAKNIHIASIVNNLGDVYRQRGDLELAEVKYKKALDMKFHEYGAGAWNADIATTLNNLGLVYSERGNLDEAEAKYKQALDMKRHVYGADARNTDIALTLNNLGKVHQQRGDLEQAEAKYKEALDMKQHVYGDAKIKDVLKSMDNLGGVYEQRASLKARKNTVAVASGGPTLKQSKLSTFFYEGDELLHGSNIQRRTGTLAVEEPPAFSHPVYELLDGDKLQRRADAPMPTSRAEDEAEQSTVNQALVRYVTSTMISMGFQERYIPDDEAAAKCPIYCTADWNTAPRLLIVLINQVGGQAGLWSRSLCFSHGVKAGSMLTCLERAIGDGYGVLVLNPNINSVMLSAAEAAAAGHTSAGAAAGAGEEGEVGSGDMVKVSILDSMSPEEHAMGVWENLVLPGAADLQEIYLLAYGNGVVLAKSILERNMALMLNHSATANLESPPAPGGAAAAEGGGEWWGGGEGGGAATPAPAPPPAPATPRKGTPSDSKLIMAVAAIEASLLVENDDSEDITTFIKDRFLNWEQQL